MVISVSVCLSVREHISGTRCPVLCVLYLWPWLVLLWRRCDMLCISGFIDDVMFAHNGPHHGAYRSVPLQQVTSLRRRAH